MNLEHQKRRDEVIEIAAEAQDVMHPDSSDNALFDLIEECTGFRLTMAEERLALVAYNENEETARRSVWYTW